MKPHETHFGADGAQHTGDPRSGEKLADHQLVPPAESKEVKERQAPALTIVVPTRNEAGNVEELLRRIGGIADQVGIEVLFVDDSDDDTPQVIESCRSSYSFDVRVLHRPAGERTGRLGGAVAAGLRGARAPWVCVMDADLQHPPELVPALVAHASQTEVDLVVASRYCGDGEASSFSMIRSAVSQGSTVAARIMFPNRLRHVSDPMSGYFLVRRAAVDVDRLRPCGFKILLEIVGRTPGLKVAEIPFQFGTRRAGQSKASLGEGVRYLQLLCGLRFGEGARRFARFGAVGATGILVNSVALAVSHELFGLFYLLAAIVATQASTLWNFAFTERWVFTGRNWRVGRPRRAAMYFAMNNAALALRGPTMFVLTSALGVNYLLSNLVTLVLLMVLRFSAADRMIWGGLSIKGLVPTNVQPAAAPAASANEGV
ncbi:MAG: dolichol-phosphate mannosyltransferase [Thermomicrobiales bacterium]|nr:dolichol-phosphate mannosyltransferase [Thermomicrobiales bacterium]